MYKYIAPNLIYIIWTFLNVTHDSIFKYYNNLHYSFIFFMRYLIIFIITLIINKKFNINGDNNIIKNKKKLMVLNSGKGIATLLGMIFVCKQLENYSLFSLNLIFFSIPLFDILIEKIILSPKKNIKIISLINENLIVFLNNIVIFLFLIKETYLYGLSKNLYGILASLMFSISNIFILKTQRILKQNIKYISYDINQFSFIMFLLSILLIFCFKFNKAYFINHIYSLFNFHFFIYILLGTLIQFLLYYLFIKNDFTPSSILVSIDLIVSLIFGFFLGNEKISEMEVIIIIIIIYISLIKKIFFINK